MSRLIDADALLEQTQFRLPVDNLIAECYADAVRIHRENIEEAPTIDAVPVSELITLRDWFYESDGITMGNLAMLNKLIAKYKKDGDE